MVGLVILFPRMVMVYKDDRPRVDPATIQLEIPETEPGRPVRRPHEGPAAARGSRAKAPGAREKTPEEKATEEIEQALRGGK